MNVRQSLLELAARHHLSRPHTQQMLQAAGLVDEPAALAVWLPRGVAVLAAALGGLGVVMWIAANWDSMGRLGHFALLQGLILATGAGAALIPRARAPLGLLALLGIGGLFAYFGQTYQTGADTWQLFALWGVLALPLCLGARSDVLWAPWALVVVTAISLWVHAYSGHRWSVQAGQLRVHLLAWTAALALVGALSSHWQRYTGAGVWGFRTAVTLAVVAVTATAFGGLFYGEVRAQYLLGVLLLALCAGLLSAPRLMDVFALSAVALGLNALLVGGLVGGLVRWLGDGAWNGDWLGRLLLIGLFAAGLLAAMVSAILRLSRRPLADGALA